jgi:muconolactone delta-isomerase
MEFVVIARAVDQANVPPQVQIALAKQTFQMLKANKDPRIKHMYGFAGERAGLMIVEAKSGDEITEIISSLPLNGISTFEIHPVGSVDAVLKSIEQAEQRVAAMAPVAAR